MTAQMGQESWPGVASGRQVVVMMKRHPFPREVWTRHYGNRAGTVTEQMMCALRVRFEEQRMIKLDGEVGRR